MPFALSLWRANANYGFDGRSCFDRLSTNGLRIAIDTPGTTLVELYPGGSHYPAPKVELRAQQRSELRGRVAHNRTALLLHERLHIGPSHRPDGFNSEHRDDVLRRRGRHEERVPIHDVDLRIARLRH